MHKVNTKAMSRVSLWAKLRRKHTEAAAEAPLPAAVAAAAAVADPDELAAAAAAAATCIIAIDWTTFEEFTWQAFTPTAFNLPISILSTATLHKLSLKPS